MQRKAMKLNVSTMWYVILRMDSAGSSWCPAGFLLRVWHLLSGSSYTQRQVPAVPANLLSSELNPTLLLVLPHLIINIPFVIPDSTSRAENGPLSCTLLVG